MSQRSFGAAAGTDRGEKALVLRIGRGLAALPPQVAVTPRGVRETSAQVDRGTLTAHGQTRADHQRDGKELDKKRAEAPEPRDARAIQKALDLGQPRALGLGRDIRYERRGHGRIDCGNPDEAPETVPPSYPSEAVAGALVPFEAELDARRVEASD